GPLAKPGKGGTRSRRAPWPLGARHQIWIETILRVGGTRHDSGRTGLPRSSLHGRDARMAQKDTQEVGLWSAHLLFGRPTAAHRPGLAAAGGRAFLAGIRAARP